MPIVSNTFQPAAWIDGATPAIDASELSAMSNAIKASQGGGACDTAAATAAKAVAVSGFALLVGATVCAKFSLGNTAAAPTLNVNNTGAFGIRCRGAEINPRDIPAGYVGSFQFDGSYWQLLNPAVQYLSGTATLTTANWTGTAAPFVYELSAPGVSDSDAPLIDYVGGADAAAAELIKAGWLIAVSSYVKPMATANKITFKAKEKPTVNVPMRWEVVR